MYVSERSENVQVKQQDKKLVLISAPTVSRGKFGHVYSVYLAGAFI